VITGSIHRDQLYADLGQRWDMNYAAEGKRRAFTKTIKRRLDDDPLADVLLAIDRAKQLYEERQALPLSEQNPVTTVYRLVVGCLI
jgi:hypothetical protein